jgi:hypothetical protein
MIPSPTQNTKSANLPACLSFLSPEQRQEIVTGTWRKGIRPRAERERARRCRRFKAAVRRILRDVLETDLPPALEYLLERMEMDADAAR